MAYTLEQFAADCHAALKADPGPAGREKVRQFVAKACKDEGLRSKYLNDSVEKERTVLYEDKELGFCICGHVYKGAKQGSPHDHGPTWAIYGQSEGETEMTDWEIVSPAKDGKPAKVKMARKYKLSPGDAHVYNEGVVHAPYRASSTRLIRIEGVDTMTVKRTPIEVAE